MQLKRKNSIKTLSNKDKQSVILFMQDSERIEIRRINKDGSMKEIGFLIIDNSNQRVDDNNFEVIDDNGEIIRMNFLSKKGTRLHFKIENKEVFKFLNYDYIPTKEYNMREFKTAEEISDVIENFFKPLFEKERAYDIGFYTE